MRLKSINLLEAKWTEGIKSFTLKRLPKVICLVGKNGSGKSRLLRLIPKILDKLTISQIVSDEYLASYPASLTKLLVNKEAALIYATLYDYSDGLKTNIGTTEYSKLARDFVKSIVKNGGESNNAMQLYKEVFTRIKKDISGYIKVVKNSDLRILQDALDDSFEKMIDTITEEHIIDEFSLINKAGLNFLKFLPSKLAFDSYETKGDDKKFRSRKAYSRFLSLKELVKTFLDKDLDWEGQSLNEIKKTDGTYNVDFKGLFKINGRELNFNEFSDGEKVLFSYCMLFFIADENPNVNLSKSIILIDEPELNLHPRAQSELLHKLKSILSDDGQLWIATHSLSIISELEVENIILMKNGELSHPKSSTPFASIEELIGFEEHYYKFFNLLSSVAEWSCVNFAAQCLTNPDVISEAGDNDPQVKILREFLNTQSGLSLLDYGAGKGRLFKELTSFLDASLDEMPILATYDAMEVNDDFVSLLNALPGIDNVYSSINKIPKNQYDLVLVCGVLHEIDVREWGNVLNKLLASLKTNGYIMVIEDQFLPRGERPTDHGYIIMRAIHLQVLFGLKDLPISISPLQNINSNRITCTLISKAASKKIVLSNIIKSLNLLKADTRSTLFELKKNYDKTDAKKGRLLSFYSQHYINIEIALNLLELPEN